MVMDVTDRAVPISVLIGIAIYRTALHRVWRVGRVDGSVSSKRTIIILYYVRRHTPVIIPWAVNECIIIILVLSVIFVQTASDRRVIIESRKRTEKLNL